MGQLVFQANAGGQTALVGPNPSTSISINIPATNGNMVTTGDSGTVTSTMLASSVYTAPGTIGSGTPNTGAFTTLSASSTVSGTGFTNYLASPPAIGGTAPNAVSATTLTLGGTQNQQLGQGNASIMKNRIINGAMVIDQRNAGASITPTNGQYSVDRYRAELTQASKYSLQQVSDAPAGFVNSLKVTSLSAYSVTSADSFSIRQAIEAYNTSDLMYGTASAQTVTVSFWVKSSLTGTFGASLSNAANTLLYNFNYTISVANTWEYKTATIVGPTSGTWLTTNNTGIFLRFNLGLGSTYGSTTVGSWVAGTDIVGNPNATSVVGTNGATFYITGVQLEVGASATGFEYRQYQQELALCQRYFQNWNALNGANTILGVGMGNGTSACDVGYPFKVSMRSTPTITYSTISTTFTLSPSAIAVSGLNIVDSSSEIACLRFVATVTNSGAYKAVANTTGAFINFSSEL